MKLFVDTGNVKGVEALAAIGILNGVTTNPTLLAKEGGDYRRILARICETVKGPVSAEVVATDAAGMIREGKADAYSHGSSVGHATWVDITTNVDVRFLPLSPKVIAELAAAGLAKVTIPKGAFKGVDEAMPSVGSPTILITRADLDEELVYVVTKAIAENKAVLDKGHASLKHFDPETAWQPGKLGIDLHPGAIRYYKERGWMN